MSEAFAGVQGVQGGPEKGVSDWLNSPVGIYTLSPHLIGPKTPKAGLGTDYRLKVGAYGT